MEQELQPEECVLLAKLLCMKVCVQGKKKFCG